MGFLTKVQRGGVSSSNELYFRTEHLAGDLRGSAVRGGAATIVAQVVRVLIQFGSTAALARLLVPADFGLVAMVTAVTGFVAMFKDAGLSSATVQWREITHAQVSALFWINVALSIGVMLLVAAMAPAIAYLYSEPRLVSITLVVSASFVFGGLTVQHYAILRRQMRFKAIASLQVASVACGVGVSVVMALLGFGYWSLVSAPVSMAVSNAVLVWLVCRWRPSFPNKAAGIGEMLRFGGGLTGFSFLNYATRNLDNVLIGAVLGAGPLGLYSKSYNLLLLPIRQINGPVNNVAISVLSRLQEEPDRFRRFFLRAVRLMAAATMPVVGLVFADTTNFVLTVLGPQWTETVPVFRWLAPAAILGAINVVPSWLCTALGRSGRQLRWALISSPVMMASFAVSVHFGIVAVAGAFSISWSVLFLLFVVMACRDTSVKPIDILNAMTAPFLAACTGVGVVLVSRGALAGMPAPLALLSNGVLFGVSYTVVWSWLTDWRADLALLRDLRSPAREVGSG